MKLQCASFRCYLSRHGLVDLYLFGVISVLKVNKSKAPGSARLLVIYDRDVYQGAVFREDIPQVPLRGVQAQAKNSEAKVWIRICL